MVVMMNAITMRLILNNISSPVSFIHPFDSSQISELKKFTLPYQKKKKYA